MKEGDVYQTILRDGRFGAVKVLKTGGRFDFSTYDFHLIGVTTYISNDIPKIDNPRLNEILVNKRCSTPGEKAICIYCGDFPKSLTFIGNVPLSAEESKLKIEINDGTNHGFSSCGKISETIGYEILIEWRYKYDNKAFLEDIEIARQKHQEFIKASHRSKPRKMIGDERFWKIIALLDWSQQGDDDKVLEPAVKELSKLKATQIKQFEETLAYKLFQLDTKGHAKNIGKYAYDEKENYVSSDSFLYARCAAVANGQMLYEKIIANPVEMVKDVEFEALLSLASTAYELKTGKEFEYDSGVSYETYSNVKGWD
ncbi:MAG TPA: DUF4240 domain-containing protein [Mucilaginibacter sp.]|nr:DUF4240 domain-containing protein [Mucilaginibacter sp.]